MNKGFSPIRRSIAVIVLVMLVGLVNEALAHSQPEQATSEPLKELSLAQLGDVEVTTASKEPEEVWKTPAGDLRSHPTKTFAAPGLPVFRKSCGWFQAYR